MPPRLAQRILALLLSGTLAAAPAAGQSAAVQKPPAATANPAFAKKLFAQARQAEEAGDWRAAFELYAEAAREMPGSREYLERREAARFRVVQEYMDRAETAALAGRLEEARTELRAALALDPTYAVAQERLAQLAPRPPLEPPAARYRDRPVEIELPRGTRSFSYRGDTRGAYEEVAKQFGLAASFDLDLRSREIRFGVDDVNFETAMGLLGQQTTTFWIALDRRSFFVTDDTAQKRRQYEPAVQRTISLAGLATAEQMTEMVRLVREICGIARTQLDTRTRTLTLRDSPQSVALATRLIEQLEAATGEMMLEVELLEVDRDAARRLGVTPPTSARTFSISPQDIDEAQQSSEALLRVLQRIFGSPGITGGFAGAGQSGLGALIPPLVAFGGGNSILLATLPGAAAEFSKAFSLLRGARRVLLRAHDGQPATFFIGERFPVALGILAPNLFSPLAGAVGASSFPRTDLAAADGPVAVVTGDFNSDGRTDLVVANANVGSVSFFPGNGDGTFGARAEFPAGNSPNALAAADFNADGRADLAVSNEQGDDVSILLGNGDGTFAAPVNFAVGDAPRAILAADFNGDSRPDLAVADSGSNTVSILLGNGTGAFGAASSVPVGFAPRGLAASTVNAGTALDLVVANQDSDSVSLLLGNGNGGFSLLAELAVGQSPAAVALADFNADSFADLGVANSGSDTVSVLLGNGDGTFGAGTEFTAGDGPLALATGDFNVDGRTDVITANQASDTVTVLLGTGDGGFGLRADFATGDGPTSLAAADFNGDGRRDVAVTNRDADSISIILNQTVLVPPGAVAFNQGLTSYPGAQYEDLGLKVRATPRLHPNREVTLQLLVEIRSRTGETVNGIPVFSNRAIEQTVRLREDERTLLSGLLQRTDSRGRTGWPGLSSVPLAGHAAGRRDDEARETELLIVITPRRIRLAERIDRMLYAGREREVTGGAPPQ